ALRLVWETREQPMSTPVISHEHLRGELRAMTVQETVPLTEPRETMHCGTANSTTTDELLLASQAKSACPNAFGETSDIENVRTSSALGPPDERPSPEQLLMRNELQTALLQAISNLREHLRSVILLKEVQRLTSAEIARRLGLTVSAVKARVCYARRVLRK